jgi:hypothetical protein
MAPKVQSAGTRALTPCQPKEAKVSSLFLPSGFPMADVTAIVVYSKPPGRIGQPRRVAFDGGGRR